MNFSSILLALLAVSFVAADNTQDAGNPVLKGKNGNNNQDQAVNANKGNNNADNNADNKGNNKADDKKWYKCWWGIGLIIAGILFIAAAIAAFLSIKS